MNCICERERRGEVWSPDEAEGVMEDTRYGGSIHGRKGIVCFTAMCAVMLGSETNMFRMGKRVFSLN